jgi:hypothetical protein
LTRNLSKTPLHVKETALERNHDSVRAIAGSKLRKNALEMALDCVLRDSERLRDDYWN